MGVVPLVPFALWGGSLSDRFPKRRLLLITQSLMLLQAVVLGVLTWTGLVQIWHVYVMAFLLGAFKAVDMPAQPVLRGGNGGGQGRSYQRRSG